MVECARCVQKFMVKWHSGSSWQKKKQISAAKETLKRGTVETRFSLDCSDTVKLQRHTLLPSFSDTLLSRLLWHCQTAKV
uniref:Uncharacterized protein n=1 Tax=Aegilops tauschii subsp. strangulata TaxID=200361 RepID=A0A453GVU0_AEGTS